MNAMNLPTIRLAHFVPFEDIDLSHSTKHDLVINALLLSNTAMDINTIKNYIASQFGCELEESLLVEILQQMVESSHVDKTQNTYNLSYSIYSKLRTQIDEITAFQDKVIDTWCNNILLPTYVHVQEEIIEELKRKLPEFLSNLFLEHGAESRALIEQSVQLSHENAHTILNKIIFEHEESKRIAQIEFFFFLSSSDANTRRYLEILIDKAFRYLTTVCDSEVFEAIKKSIQESIEHIYPQVESLAWKGKVLKRKEFHTNRIGNLLILPIGLNKKLQNFGFEIKKSEYKETPMLTVKEVVKLDDWNMTTIELRTESLLQWAQKEWEDIKL